MTVMAQGVDPSAAISVLEVFWRMPDGVFYRLRQGEYAPRAIDEVEATLKAIRIDQDSDLPRRFVSLTWFIPTFMEWQIERVAERGGDTVALRHDINRLRNLLNDLLGLP